MIDFDVITRRARIACAALVMALPTPALAAVNWKIDPARTHIAFAIDAIGYPRTHGEFRQFTGRISVDFAHPDKSSVSFHVQSQSVDVGSGSFDDYLRSVISSTPRTFRRSTSSRVRSQRSTTTRSG